MQSEQDPNYTRQKVNWVDLEEESEEEKVHDHQKSSSSKPIKPVQEAKKLASQTKQTQDKKAVNPSTNKEKNTGKNVFVCEDLEVDDANEKEGLEAEKTVKKDNALSDLLKVNKKPEEKTKPVVISKKEQKKRELDELDKILNELGLQPENKETINEASKPVSEGEALNKKKKKKEKEEKKAENPEEKEKHSNSVEKKPEKTEETSNSTPLNKEQAIQAALKKHAEKKKQTGLNLDNAKSEILARQEKAKKKEKTKKKYEDQ